MVGRGLGGVGSGAKEEGGVHKGAWEREKEEERDGRSMHKCSSVHCYERWSEYDRPSINASQFLG